MEITEAIIEEFLKDTTRNREEKEFLAPIAEQFIDNGIVTPNIPYKELMKRASWMAGAV